MKRALVTGGSGAIGAAICRVLGASGHHVMVHANRHIDQANEITQAIINAGGSAQACCFDIAKTEETASALAKLLEAGPIQILINNAGVHCDAPLAGMTAEQWRLPIDVSLNGFFNVTQPLLLPMIKTRWGRIVSMSSVAGIMGNRGQANYAAAKAGLYGATKSLAREIASRGVTVNAVAPGVIESPMAASAFNKEMIKNMIPMQRSGTPEEVAQLVKFLVSDEAAYISGQLIAIDGGLT